MFALSNRRRNATYVKRAVIVVLVVLIAASFTSCGLFASIFGQNRSITGALAPEHIRSSRALLDGGVVEELWLIHIERGNDSVIIPGTVAQREVFTPDADGEFEVTLPGYAGEYALLLARPSEVDPKDEIVAAITFRVDAENGSLILPSAGVIGEVDLGVVTIVDGEGVPANVISSNSGSLTRETIITMRQLADADNSVKLLVNDHVNYTGSGHNYGPEISVEYSGPSVADVLARTATADDFSYDRTEVYVFTDDADTQLTFESPSGTPQGSSGNYGEGSANKWNLSISNIAIEPGWWRLLDASTGAQLAEFNLAIGLPADQSGAPLSIVPLPRFVTDGDGLVTGIEVDWVASDGSGAVELTDPMALDILIGTQEFNFTASDSPGTYMFNRDHMGLTGTFTSMTLSEPFDPATVTQVHFWYRFGYYRVLVRYPAT